MFFSTFYYRCLVNMAPLVLYQYLCYTNTVFLKPTSSFIASSAILWFIMPTSYFIFTIGKGLSTSYLINQTFFSISSLISSNKFSVLLYFMLFQYVNYIAICINSVHLKLITIYSLDLIIRKFTHLCFT